MFLKDPEAVLEYCVDWTDALSEDVSITSSEWRVRPEEPGGISIGNDNIRSGITAVMLGSGLPGHVYEIGNLVTLSDGTSDERSIVLRLEDR